MKYVPPLGGGANDPYVDGDPQTGTKGSIVPAAAIEDVMREVVNAITAAGLTPDDADLTQLAQAIPGVAGLPASSTDKALARFNGTTGILKDSPNGPFVTDDGKLLSKLADYAFIGGKMNMTFPPGDDLDNAIDGGWYRADGGTSNRPPWTFSIVLAAGITNAELTQLAFDRTNLANIAHRQRFSGAWSSWARILTENTPASESAAGAMEIATTAEARSNAAGAKALTAAKRKDMAAWVALSDAATIALDLDTFVNGKVDGVAGNRTIGNPTNGADGLEYTVWLIGDSATARTISFGANFKGDLPLITDLTDTKQYLLIIKRLSATQFTASAKVVNQ